MVEAFGPDIKCVSCGTTHGKPVWGNKHLVKIGAGGALFAGAVRLPSPPENFDIKAQRCLYVCQAVYIRAYKAGGDPSLPDGMQLAKKGTELRRKLFALLAPEITHSVVEKDISIYVVTSKVNRRSAPASIALPSGDVAIFEKLPPSRKGGSARYKYCTFFIQQPHCTEEELKILTEAAHTFYGATKLPLRTEEGREGMKSAGYRHSRRSNTVNGSHYSLHEKKGQVYLEDEVMASVLASLLMTCMVSIPLAGAITRQLHTLFKHKGHIWLCDYPLSALHMTVNFFSRMHRDPRDLGDAFIIWLDFGSRVSSCEFVLPEYGVHFLPTHGSMIALDAAHVVHGTVNPMTEGGAGDDSGRIGIALGAKKIVATSEFTYRSALRKLPTEEAQLERMLHVLGSPSDLSPAWTSKPTIKAALKLYNEK